MNLNKLLQTGILGVPPAPPVASAPKLHICGDNVEQIVDDVSERAKRFGFAINSRAQAREVAKETSDLLNLDASSADISEAASRLYSE